MIKVLLVAKDLYDSAGVSNMAINQAQHVYNTGEVEFHVAAHRVRDGMNWVAGHIPLPQQSRWPLLSDEEYPLKITGTIKKAIRDVKPDIVHVHTQMLIPPKGVPSLCTVHGTYQRELPYVWKYPLPLTYKIFQILYTYNIYAVERLCLGHYDHYQVTSTKTKEEILSMGIKEELISQVPNGVGIDGIQPGAVPPGLKEKYGIPPGGKIVLSVGSMTTRKGHHVVAESARKVLDAHPDAEFVFVGPVPKIGWHYITLMKRNATRAGVLPEKLHFLGPLPQEDLVGFYNTCAVYASGSLVEGFGLNVVEAAACEKPVVSNDVGAVKDVLGNLGTVVPIGDTRAFAEGINRALDGPARVPGLRRRIEDRYSWKQIGEDMLEVYRKTATLKK